ncbi:retron system putative HNH endonuclease [Anabaena sp. UHCC 0187]|uniref:retron system putative HNH endonuclease n=1 Tax=Anabaena sp. UHCC 0187 TaxID=2590018 RepID=UPI002110CAAE|nr:retron system putative HNH endonuclease [Anabaena sp. UHCC 0187]
MLTEQGYICCYCMRRISEENMEIEHWEPQSKYPELQINYKNLLASCSGNRGSKKNNQHCNPKKGDAEITINPADFSKNCENQIRYSSTGKIFSDDENINTDLNEILNLNYQTLIDNRKIALHTVITVLNRKFPNKTWSKESLKKTLEELSSKDAEGKYSPYCQYIFWYLNKRLNNP